MMPHWSIWVSQVISVLCIISAGRSQVQCDADGTRNALLWALYFLLLAVLNCLLRNGG